MQVDFNLFFERCFVVIVLTRLQLVFSVAANDIFAAKVFNAHSATARLRIVNMLCNAPIVEVA